MMENKMQKDLETLIDKIKKEYRENRQELVEILLHNNSLYENEELTELVRNLIDLQFMEDQQIINIRSVIKNKNIPEESIQQEIELLEQNQFIETILFSNLKSNLQRETVVKPDEMFLEMMKKNQIKEEQIEEERKIYEQNKTI